MTDHSKHRTTIIFGPFGNQYAKEICLKCNNAFVSWRSEGHLLQVLEDELTSLNRRGTSIDLNVPFHNKDQVKKLGAKFDGHKRVWYVESTSPNIKELAKWITHEAIDLYEANQNTPKVKSTPELQRYWEYKDSQLESMIAIEEFEIQQRRDTYYDQDGEPLDYYG